jgi:60 kDa SS-A/Ro ribonucleoprotein
MGMTATDISIADPADGGMLDIVGFDTAVPSLIAEFAAAGAEGLR